MGRSEPAALLEEEAFQSLRPRLRAVADAAPPHFDPRALALRALVVADRLGQADLRPKVEALAHAGACDPGTIEDLRAAARALLHVLSMRGPALDMGDSPAAGAARAEALELKRSGIDALEVLDDDEARLWLDVFRLPCDDLGLVFDLRSMAVLYEQHGGLLGDGGGGRSARAARRCADALEGPLLPTARAGEWSRWIDPAFTTTLALYEDVCRVGRFLATSDALGLAFPSPASMARARRRHRAPPTSAISTVRRAPAVPPPLPAIDAQPELTEADLEPTPPSEPSSHRASPASVPPDAGGHGREAARRSIELEVSLESESNFYVGFTENLSESGVFVATYLARPLGSRVDLSLRLSGRDRPLAVRGEVRWVRLYSPTSDAGPGMGIRFAALSDADRAEIHRFLAARDPIFFPD